MTRFWVIPDVAQETQIPEATRQMLDRVGVRAAAIIPLQAGDQTIGVVIVYRATPGPFSPVAVRLYQTLVEQAAVTLERARLTEESRQQAAQELALREIADQVTSATDLETMLQVVLADLGPLVGAAGGYVELAVPGE